MAAKTLTDDFWSNDILWQLSTFAYNISTIMRYKHKRFAKQEHRTFKEWFIDVPAKLVESGRMVEMKIYKNHYHKQRWLEFEQFVQTA